MSPSIVPPEINRTRVFIGGEFVDPRTGRSFATHAPSSGAVLAQVAEGGEADIDAAVHSARAAYEAGAWSRSPARRKEVLQTLALLVDEHAAELAALDAVDAGKALTDCENDDLPEVAHLFRWYAEAIDKVYGAVSPSTEGSVGLITREPVGVVGVVVPWNYPAVMFAYKVAPALAAGNSVVVKPAELAPLSALLLAELAARAGVPDGVLNVVPGIGTVAGRALGLHPLVDAVAFTGSTVVGREFLRYAADSNLKNVVTELGGKSPQIVMSDMAGGLDVVVSDLALAAFANAGQNCTAGSRVLVPRGLAEEVIDRLTAAAAAVRVGEPLDRTTEMGPLITSTAVERVARYVDRAIEQGAHVTTGGSAVLTSSGGSYFAPTVVRDVRPDSAVVREEIFGPVVCVLGFDDEAEALRLANDTDYGLAATVWTHDLDTAIRMSRGIRAGTIAVNGYSEGDVTTPFGGHRTSGFGGRDGGLQAFDQYTELKTTWVTLR